MVLFTITEQKIHKNYFNKAKFVRNNLQILSSFKAERSFVYIV